MKIVFISNYLNDHQFEFCQKMYEKNEGEFYFIQTSEITDERKKLGWNTKYPNAKFFIDINLVENKYIKKIYEQADVFIIGDTSVKIYRYKIKKSALILFYRERLFKKQIKISNVKKLYLRTKYTFGYYKFKRALLCASAYAPNDFMLLNLFKNKMYKWGYFPPFKKYDIYNLLERKRKNSIVKILWVGRLIDWKRCEDVISMVNVIKNYCHSFELKIIGGGELIDKIRGYIKNDNISNFVKLIGPCNQDTVRKYMEEANIFVMTSNYEEGWGAVVNEAMNSGCAVIASHAAGSVPYLIRNYENGIIYKCGDIEQLSKLVLQCINNEELREKLGKNAYKTIEKVWNAENSSSQLIELINKLNGKSENNLKINGPCSIAKILDAKWYSEEACDKWKK